MWNSDPEWPPLFTTAGFCTFLREQPELLTSNSILIVTELLFVWWSLCSWIFPFVVIEVWWMQKEKRDGGIEGEVDRVSSPVAFTDEWMNEWTDLRVFLNDINWLTGALTSLFYLVGHVYLPCPARAQCALCLCVFSPSHVVSCVTNVPCILIGSLTWF